MRSGRPSMDKARAKELRAEGLTWREVGVRLAEEEGRDMPYQPSAVMTAVYGYRERRMMERLAGRGPYDD